MRSTLGRLDVDRGARHHQGGRQYPEPGESYASASSCSNLQLGIGDYRGGISVVVDERAANSRRAGAGGWYRRIGPPANRRLPPTAIGVTLIGLPALKSEIGRVRPLFHAGRQAACLGVLVLGRDVNLGRGGCLIHFVRGGRRRRLDRHLVLNRLVSTRSGTCPTRPTSRWRRHLSPRWTTARPRPPAAPRSG